MLSGCSVIFQLEPSNEGVLYKGIYTFGFEVSDFSSSDDTYDYWLYSTNQALDDIDQSLMNTIINGDGQNPYPSVYIEFYGHNDGASSIEDGEVTASYDALINVLRVVRIGSHR